ncbi:serine/threonine-protein kinase [Ahniella affigens]|nr:serine/threonine-protein kinase [Ahniella affigens]
MTNDPSPQKRMHQLQQVRDLLDHVLDAADSQREQILADCDDPWIREQVRQMIEPSLQAERHDAAISPRIPARFGPYRVVRPLGHGGMGSVFLAERDDGTYRQHVAIKVIRHAMGSVALFNRFQRERQILAGLQHQNIARMYDGGVLDNAETPSDALPWYAMEYVPGDTLDQLIAHNSLSARESVRLMIKLANAVQYAHQNLIVHRDLKPQNIIVDPLHEPKLLDFGVATMLSEPGAAQTNSRAPMTLAYAAPEQIRGAPISAATDLYSLGVMLFELLTGKRPHKVRDGDPAGISLLQAITDTDAPAPSTILKQQTSPTSTRQQAVLRGDLDTIVLKALEREPTRRYATVQAFAEDLQNWLEQRPIRARPNSWWYRTSKWIRRNPLATGLATVLFLSLIGFGVVLVQQRNTAIRQAQRADATKNFVINSFAQANRWVSGREVTARELALQGLQAVATQLADQPEARIEMYGVLANTLARTDALREAAHAQALELAEMQQLGTYDAATLAHRTLQLAQHYWWAEDIPAALSTLDQVAKNPALPPAQQYSAQMLRSVIGAMRGDTTAVATHWPELPTEVLIELANQVPEDQRFNARTVPAYRPAYELQAHLVNLQRDKVLRDAERVVAAADQWLPKDDINRGAFMMFVGTALASFATEPRAEAVIQRSQHWIVKQFGANHEFAQDIPTATLAAQYRAGAFEPAEAAYQHIHDQYQSDVQRTNLDCRDVERIGGLVALARGDHVSARTRLTDARICAANLDDPNWESPHTREADAALAYLDELEGNTTARQRLQAIAAAQAARDDGGWWQSAIWLADAAWQRQEHAAARAELAELVRWFQHRGWPYPTQLVDACRRAGAPMPKQVEPDLSRILPIAEILLTDAERIQNSAQH